MAKSKQIEVYHGSPYKHGSNIFASSIVYELARGKSEVEALSFAQSILDRINDNTSPEIQLKTLDLVQESGNYSPFICCSRQKSVARSFGCPQDSDGYIYTVIGPEKSFYDINKIRAKLNFPPNPTFEWLEELGIPLKLQGVFQIKRIEHIQDIDSKAKIIYEKK